MSEKSRLLAPKPLLAWGRLTEEGIARRDGHILELWAMGWTQRKIAETVGLTPQRVSQVIRGVQ